MQDNDAAQAGVQPLSKPSQELMSTESVRSKIKISNHQLLELVHSEQKLLDRINQLNHQGVLLISAESYTQALAFFGQCEKNLEYAASCGRTIDRNLIIAILNNQAMAYQRLQEHQKSASYVQAIIYNLKMFLESRQNQLLEGHLRSIPRSNSQRHSLNLLIKGQLATIYSFISRKNELAIYLLQFSGLYLQCLSHEDSLRNAKLALVTMKQLCSVNYSLLSAQQNQNIDILKELSQIPLDFQKNQYQIFRNQFQKLNRINSQTNVSQDQQLYFQKSEDIQAINFQSIFSLKPRSVQQSILQSQSILWNTINHENHQKKVILVICMYFTIGVQLDQMASDDFGNSNSIYMFGSQKKTEKDDSIYAEMYHLMALIVGLKHLPYGNKFLQNLISIYRQHYTHKNIQSPLREQKSINQHLDKLTQKYKNYLIERDVSMSIDQESSSLIKQIDSQSQKKWNEQKKQSKKLNELLKQDIPQVFVNRGGQQSYFMEVPSIDSISMANSVSANKKDNSNRGEQSKYLNNNKKGKINLHPKLKSSKTIGYQSRPSQFYPTPPDSHNPISERSREEQYYDSTKRQKKKILYKSKSKSTQRNKSKTKLAQTKTLEKNMSNTVINTNPVLTLMTTVTDRSNKKIKFKRSLERDQKFIIGSAGGQANKWVGELKKITSSDQIKSIKPNQFTSVKNVQTIKMNKVKSPLNLKMVSSIPMNDAKPSQTIRLEQRKGNNSQKNKSKSKSSASFKSKKSENNSKNKKSLSKTIKNSKQKIYTSIKQTIKRR